MLPGAKAKHYGAEAPELRRLSEAPNLPELGSRVESGRAPKRAKKFFTRRRHIAGMPMLVASRNIATRLMKRPKQLSRFTQHCRSMRSGNRSNRFTAYDLMNGIQTMRVIPVLCPVGRRAIFDPQHYRHSRRPSMTAIKRQISDEVMKQKYRQRYFYNATQLSFAAGGKIQRRVYGV